MTYSIANRYMSMALPVMQFTYDDQVMQCSPGESLLTAALRHNVAIPHNCQSGICQSCLIKIIHGDIPSNAQKPLSRNDRAQKLALACMFEPTSDVEAKSSQTLEKETVHVIEKIVEPNGVLRLFLSKPNFSWHAGQFISIWKDDTTLRPYSIASLPTDSQLEFHIRKHTNGSVSQWLHETLKTGDTIKISTPKGNCSYVDSMQSKTLILAGTGTGLAPLLGIVRDALAQSHSGKIFLYIGARENKQLYLADLLNSLASEHQNFSWLPVLKTETDGYPQANDLADYVVDQFPSFNDTSVFLCGNAQMVKKLQKLCFLKGASMSDIFADPFVTSQ